MAEPTPTPAQGQNAAAAPDIAVEADAGLPASAGLPGSASADHPRDGIPLPARGFETLDLSVRILPSVPAAESISRAARLLMTAAAEKLGLSPGEEPDIDLDDARQLITALAGLLAPSLEDPDGGPEDHRAPLLAGLRTLQHAFREASVHPDAPGDGPGEALLT